MWRRGTAAAAEAHQLVSYGSLYIPMAFLPLQRLRRDIPRIPRSPAHFGCFIQVLVRYIVVATREHRQDDSRKGTVYGGTEAPDSTRLDGAICAAVIASVCMWQKLKWREI